MGAYCGAENAENNGTGEIQDFDNIGIVDSDIGGSSENDENDDEFDSDYDSHRHHLKHHLSEHNRRVRHISGTDAGVGMLDPRQVPISKTKPYKSEVNLNRILPQATDASGHRIYPKRYNSQVRLYQKLPLRSMSRAWGQMNSIQLPVPLRKPCFYLYSWMFGCNLDECAEKDLNEYRNLSEFFRRQLKPDARQVDQRSCLVSPCDGRILHFGKVDKGYLEQVKGVNYLLEAFLGEQTWPKNKSSPSAPTSTPTLTQQNTKPSFESERDYHHQFEKNILYNPEENSLYHCIIYLAPGDYHRFHSPADWQIFFRRHFPGELFSVNPSVARWLQGLFNLNERVVYYGEWKYGFFSMAPVGATNVGSISVYEDPELTTNNKTLSTFEQDLERNFVKTKFTTQYDSESEDENANKNETSGISGIKIGRGDQFGEFNLGSTIVLVFEAPKNFEFNIQPNQKVRYGMPIGATVSRSNL